MEYVKMDGYALSRWISENEAYDTYDRLKYINPKSICKEIHYLCREDDKVIGVLSLEVNPSQPTDMWIPQIAVDKAYRGRGISKELIRMAFADIPNAYPQITTLSPSSFTETGRARMKHTMDACAHLLGDVELKYSTRHDFEDDPEDDPASMSI